jgi:hypothetical protein
MSLGVTCDESKVLLLTQLLASGPWAFAQMLLSEADITPDRSTVAADLTADEVSVGGYARQAVTSFDGPTLDGSGFAFSQADVVTFLNTSGGDSGTIFTWGIIDSSNGKLIEAGRWDTPFVLVATSGNFPTRPTVRLRGE